MFDNINEDKTKLKKISKRNYKKLFNCIHYSDYIIILYLFSGLCYLLRDTWKVLNYYNQRFKLYGRLVLCKEGVLNTIFIIKFKSV